MEAPTDDFSDFRFFHPSINLCTQTQTTMTMAQQRMPLWAAEEIGVDEDIHDEDLSLAIGNYGQGAMYDDRKYITSLQVYGADGIWGRTTTSC